MNPDEGHNREGATEDPLADSPEITLADAMLESLEKNLVRNVGPGRTVGVMSRYEAGRVTTWLDITVDDAEKFKIFVNMLVRSRHSAFLKKGLFLPLLERLNTSTRGKRKSFEVERPLSPQRPVQARETRTEGGDRNGPPLFRGPRD